MSGELVEYTLQLINEERELLGLHPLYLSNHPVAQEWADHLYNESMLVHNPYLPQSMGENIGQIGPGFLTLIDEYEDLEEMHNSFIESTEGHREMILDPSITQVAIGITWDSWVLYLLEDFF